MYLNIVTLNFSINSLETLKDIVKYITQHRMNYPLKPQEKPVIHLLEHFELQV